MLGSKAEQQLEELNELNAMPAARQIPRYVRVRVTTGAGRTRSSSRSIITLDASLKCKLFKWSSCRKKCLREISEREREGEGEFIKLFEMGFRFRVVQQPCPPETPGASRVSLCSANTSHLALGTWHKLRVQRGKVRRAEAGLGRAEAS